MASINLLSTMGFVEVPFIKVTIGDYTFGAYKRETSLGYDMFGTYRLNRTRYPNYVQSLQIKLEVDIQIISHFFSVNDGFCFQPVPSTNKRNFKKNGPIDIDLFSQTLSVNKQLNFFGIREYGNRLNARAILCVNHSSTYMPFAISYHKHSLRTQCSLIKQIHILQLTIQPYNSLIIHMRNNIHTRLRIKIIEVPQTGTGYKRPFVYFTQIMTMINQSIFLRKVKSLWHIRMQTRIYSRSIFSNKKDLIFISHMRPVQ